jgi:hypothetical protein
LLCILNIYRHSLTLRTVKLKNVAIRWKLNMTWKLFTKFLTEGIYVSSSKRRLYLHKYSTHTPLPTYTTATGLADFRIFKNYLLILNKHHGSEISLYSHVTLYCIIFRWFIPVMCNHKYHKRYKVYKSNTTILFWNTGSNIRQHVSAFYSNTVIKKGNINRNHRVTYIRLYLWQ